MVRRILLGLLLVLTSWLVSIPPLVTGATLCSPFYTYKTIDTVTSDNLNGNIAQIGLAKCGGTGLDTSTSTGTARVKTGVWSIADLLAESYTKAGLPAAGTAGRLARVTDTTRGLWMDQGSQWFGLSGEIVNVKEFGAVGDDTTNDSTAIANAITAAGVGGTVVFPAPATAYRLAATITLTGSVRLLGLQPQGAGGAGVQLHADAGVNAITIAPTAGSVIQIDGFYINGGAIGLNFSGGGARLDRKSQFRNLFFYSQTNTGINIASFGLIGAQFENIEVSGATNYGIFATNDASSVNSLNLMVWDRIRVTGTGTEAIHLENTNAAGAQIPALNFRALLVEANDGKGLVLKRVMVSLTEPWFEGNGIVGGGADIELQGVGAPSGKTSAILFGGYFSTANAAQSGRRILFTGGNVTYGEFGVFHLGTDSLDAGNNTGAVQVYQVAPQRSGGLPLTNYSGGAFASITGDPGFTGSGFLGAGVLAAATQLHVKSSTQNATLGRLEQTNSVAGGSLPFQWFFSDAGLNKNGEIEMLGNGDMLMRTGGTGGTPGTERWRVTAAGGGLQMGTPTGGDKGAGTINVATDVYKNNTAYTNPDYVLEHWARGRIEKFADRDGASEYRGLADLKAVEEFARHRYGLPLVEAARERARNSLGIFAGGDAVLASLEEAYLYLFQLRRQIVLLWWAVAVLTVVVTFLGWRVLRLETRLSGRG